MAMVQAMPVAVVARMVDEWDTRLWRVIHHYVEAARDRADHSEVTSVALDEMASRRGHNYVSLFVDLVCRRVLFVAEGKDAGTVDAFATDLAAHGGNPEAVAEVHRHEPGLHPHGSCVDGPRLARIFSRVCIEDQLQSCVRPGGAAQNRRP